MKKKEKADLIRFFLEQLYPDPAIPLYHTNPFTMCIAVLLSAHTTDKSVNSVTPELFALADNPKDMIRLSPEKIEFLIKRVGLSKTKSRNIWNLSHLLIEKHQAQLPSTLAELEELPGVGHKTASVVVCQAFGQNAFPVDTHIHRLAERWGLSNGQSVTKTEEDLKKIFPKESWPKLHLQFIYYGREYCPARGHDLRKCELCRKYAKASVRRGFSSK